MKNYINFVNREFLETFTVDFSTVYFPLYRGKEEKEIRSFFARQGVLIEDRDYMYHPLSLKLQTSKEYNSALEIENIKNVYEELKRLPDAVVTDAGFWTALANTDCLDYVLSTVDYLSDDELCVRMVNGGVNSNGREKKRNTAKRQLLIYAISSLYFTGRFLYDAEAENPWHFVDIVCQKRYRGNIVAIGSSNISTCDAVRLGILDMIEDLYNQGYELDRFVYTFCFQIMNLRASVCLLDILTRQEVKAYLGAHLPAYMAYRGYKLKKR